MSLPDARREVAAARATFSTALDHAADQCNNAASVLRRGGDGYVNAETLTGLLTSLVAALGVTRDATMTWAAYEELMREVEK